MKKLNVVFVGGGSTYTPDMLELMCLVKDKFQVKRIVLYDIDDSRQKIVGDYGEILFREYYPELEEFVVTSDKKVAYQDVDFAFVQIRPGGLAMRELDEKIPLKYGVIGQETCGPGGFAYGLRSVIAMKEFIEDIRFYSPEAWILNYSNPAAIVAEMCKVVFPNDNRIINICDMPISIMDVYCPLAGRTRLDVEPEYFGLNHFGWFTALYDKVTGEDILPEIIDLLIKGDVDDRLGFSGKNDEYWTYTFKHLEKMVRDYPHSLPNTYLQYYLYPKDMINHTNPEYTRTNSVIDGREKRVFEFCKNVAARGTMIGTEYDLNLKYSNDDSIKSASIAHNDAHATYIVELALSILHNSNDIFLLIVPNNGVIPNIDAGMMIEVACRVGANGAIPIHYGEIGTFEKGLLEGQYASEKLAVEAALEKSYDKALQSLVVNRTVVDTDIARNILNDYIDANGHFFPNLVKSR